LAFLPFTTTKLINRDVAQTVSMAGTFFVRHGKSRDLPWRTFFIARHG
jgi:hypothetical protein